MPEPQRAEPQRARCELTHGSWQRAAWQGGPDFDEEEMNAAIASVASGAHALEQQQQPAAS